jgi:hypothetical protein
MQYPVAGGSRDNTFVRDLHRMQFADEVRSGNVHNGDGDDSLLQRDGRSRRGRHDEASDDSTTPFRYDLGLGARYTELSGRPTHSHERDVAIGLNLRQWWV